MRMSYQRTQLPMSMSYQGNQSHNYLLRSHRGEWTELTTSIHTLLTEKDRKQHNKTRILAGQESYFERPKFMGGSVFRYLYLYLLWVFISPWIYMRYYSSYIFMIYAIYTILFNHFYTVLPSILTIQLHIRVVINHSFVLLFLCSIPPWWWLKKAKTCWRLAVRVYIFFLSN
jgi:hypothetical protein